MPSTFPVLQLLGRQISWDAEWDLMYVLSLKKEEGKEGEEGEEGGERKEQGEEEVGRECC